MVPEEIRRWRGKDSEDQGNPQSITREAIFWPFFILLCSFLRAGCWDQAGKWQAHVQAYWQGQSQASHNQRQVNYKCFPSLGSSGWRLMCVTAQAPGLWEHLPPLLGPPFRCSPFQLPLHLPAEARRHSIKEKGPCTFLPRPPPRPFLIGWHVWWVAKQARDRKQGHMAAKCSLCVCIHQGLGHQDQAAADLTSSCCTKCLTEPAGRPGSRWSSVGSRGGGPAATL